MIRIPGTGEHSHVIRNGEADRTVVRKRSRRYSAAGQPRVAAIQSVEERAARFGSRGDRYGNSVRNLASAWQTQRRPRQELRVHEVQAVRVPEALPPHLILVAICAPGPGQATAAVDRDWRRARARSHIPSRQFTRMRGPNLSRELFNAIRDVVERQSSVAQFSIFVDPGLPEIGRLKQPVPPRREVKEVGAKVAGLRTPGPRIEITAIGRALCAVVVPCRSVFNALIAVLKEIPAQAERIHVERQHFVNMPADP